MNQALTSIHPDAKIADNVNIDPFVTIHGDVEIGTGTWIGSNTVIMDGTRIGSNCNIFPGAVVGAIPQDMKYVGEDSIVRIGNNTTIREYVTVNRGTKSKGTTEVGNNSLLMAYSHIAHDCRIGNNCVLANSVQVGGEVEMDDWTVVGGGCYIHQFCRIGKHVMISGMSGVLSDVPPYLRVAGIPVVYQGINYIGLKRRDFTKEEIDVIHEIYRIIYQEKMNTSQAVEYIEKTFDAQPSKDEVLEFIKASKRGIIKSLERGTDDKYNYVGG
jgi:UDP-N-acetylglucosamine acyltransferase